MAKKMLIDATHDEEVRVAIVDGNRLEEFDSETSTKRQIKGNIYLAKVIRIEPSLQAAFVEFGGNRHGFLPFGEIHPDYFRIPVSDRTTSESGVKPLEEGEGADVADHEPKKSQKTKSQPKSKRKKVQASAITEETGTVLQEELALEPSFIDDSEDHPMDLVDEDDLPRRTRAYHYKIQEVIKRRQIMLVQVVKEERGNKGAALTTYLSLPGRYCVLMPNAGHRGGGISRKISDGSDRRRLRDILKDLEIPDGMSLIVRTAGQERNKLEIRRDFEYLLRLWEEIRETTLKATAPELIYAEGDLIKRSIRDVYNRDIDQVLVDGDDAYKAAKAFMKALIPSHTKKVQPYKNAIPLFHRYKVEEQIDVMMDPVAKLPSGGSIVINFTEALVAIDVNSGRSTRERHIDETALKTNLEAADEIGRQMRLRDLAGLIVIDFIDMNEQKHIQVVEKRLKEATSHDRARIQLGHISQFGLLEMSRQRLRPSLLETHSTSCHHCHGTGFVRSVESMSLLVLRAIENEGIKGQSSEIVVTVPSGIDLYLLNQKRSSLTAIEARYQMRVVIARDDSISPPDFRIDSLIERKALSNLLLSEPLLDFESTEESDHETSHQESLPELLSESDESKIFPHNEGNGRRRRRRRPFKRRDRQWNKSQGESPAEGENSKDHASIEEQIVTEIMGPTPETTSTSLENGKKFLTSEEKTGASAFKEQEVKKEGNDSHSRRRRRGRRHNQNRLRTQNDKEGASASVVADLPVPVKTAAVNTPSSQLISTRELPQKPRDISIPIASLPEGSGAAVKKNTHSRWWKRLLES